MGRQEVECEVFNAFSDCFSTAALANGESLWLGREWQAMIPDYGIYRLNPIGGTAVPALTELKSSTGQPTSVECRGDTHGAMKKN